MKRLRALICVACCLFVLGCFGTPTQEVKELEPKTPLSVDEWKQLPVDVKYENDTFERLKLNDPKLKQDRAWEQFMRTVVVPERKKDIPAS
ncbi:MAG: hypothetical protein RIC55_28675 [Pirellulaceae bacterium]